MTHLQKLPRLTEQLMASQEKTEVDTWIQEGWLCTFKIMTWGPRILFPVSKAAQDNRIFCCYSVYGNWKGLCFCTGCIKPCLPGNASVWDTLISTSYFIAHTSAHRTWHICLPEKQHCWNNASIQNERNLQCLFNGLHHFSKRTDISTFMWMATIENPIAHYFVQLLMPKSC